ncbi:MAG: glucosaminidase domain-containing protein [Oleibacter sp.]|nr:glucosaminidase domain-containing protein [Thalassolituus sp.]
MFINQILKETSLKSYTIIAAIILGMGLVIAAGSSLRDSMVLKHPKKMTVIEKKERFRELIVPAVDAVHKDLEKQYQEVSDLIDKDPESKKLEQLREQYNTKTNKSLLIAINPHPRSIAIAQAALESSWATSRFARQANNLFGVWSFNEDEPRLAARQKRGKTTIWIKKYDSIEDSIRDYYLILSKGKAYRSFKRLNMTTNDPEQLVTKLDKYSEKGAAYGVALMSVIRHNDFTQYDQ